jgi:asparagine N-glycosylation enzyme membrane subunit Stt3
VAGTATAAGRREASRRARMRGRRGRARPFAGIRVGDLEPLLVVCLLGLAILARWPNLLLMPHFTDEIVEVGYAAKIAAAEHFPLTAQDTYFGPLHAYILAALLKLFGPSVALPRLVIMVFGAFTVLATYLLGRELAGRAVGTVAAALLLTSPQHILINSHIAWQHSTMPLYSTLCCWAFVRALRAFIPAARQRGEGETSPSAQSGHPQLAPVYLALAGLLFGLALQTHPGAVVLIPALAATLLATLRLRRFWLLLRTPWPYVAVFAALVAYSPLLIFNLTHRLAGRPQSGALPARLCL